MCLERNTEYCDKSIFIPSIELEDIVPYFCSHVYTFKRNSALQQEPGRPLPKFGEWDVNDPASGEGFTVIFNKARDEKKGGSTPGPETLGREEPSNQERNPTNKPSSTVSISSFFTCF